jgi:hypothetical protein
MNNIPHVSEMCASMVVGVDVGEGMAKALLRRGHIASTVDMTVSSKRAVYLALMMCVF